MLTKSIGTIFRRPSILIFLAIVFGFLSYGTTLLSEVTSTYFSLEEVPKSFSEIITSITIAFTAIISNINGRILIKGLTYVMLGILVISGILALGFSGYYYTIYRALDKQPRRKHDFLMGIKKYFFKTWVINCLFLIITLILIVLSVVAMVPSFVYFGNASTDNNLIIGIVLGTVTMIVLAFTFIYYLMYVSFWYPALYSNNRRPFRYAVSLVDRNFFGIFVRLFFVIFFLLVCYIAIDFSSILFGGPLGSYAVVIKWVFNTLYFGFYTSYIFSIFRYLDRKASR